MERQRKGERERERERERGGGEGERDRERDRETETETDHCLSMQIIYFGVQFVTDDGMRWELKMSQMMV